MYLPYLGSLSKFHQPNSELLWYGGENAAYYEEYLQKNDLSKIAAADRVDGDWRYHFNSKGFRGDEYDTNADFSLAIFGCSVGVGEAVRWEQSWGSQLRDRIAASRGLKKVTCLNFSQSGASNDYITRTAIRQCAAAKPSLLVAYFTYAARKEIVEGAEIHGWGSWNADSCDLFRSQLGCYTKEEAIVNTLKNIALLQMYCVEKEIPHFFILQEIDKIFRDNQADHAVLGDYFRLIDWRRFAEFRMEWLDSGRDNRHPGPQSHRAFADRIFSHL